MKTAEVTLEQDEPSRNVGGGTDAGQVITTTENMRRQKAEGLEPSTR